MKTNTQPIDQIIQTLAASIFCSNIDVRFGVMTNVIEAIDGSAVVAKTTKCLPDKAVTETLMSEILADLQTLETTGEVSKVRYYGFYLYQYYSDCHVVRYGKRIKRY